MNVKPFHLYLILSSSSSGDKIRVTLSRKPLQGHCTITLRIHKTRNKTIRIRWNICVFKSRRKVRSVDTDDIECGRAFQARAAATGNARSSSVRQIFNENMSRISGVKCYSFYNVGETYHVTDVIRSKTIWLGKRLEQIARIAPVTF